MKGIAKRVSMGTIAVVASRNTRSLLLLICIDQSRPPVRFIKYLYMKSFPDFISTLLEMRAPSGLRNNRSEESEVPAR